MKRAALVCCALLWLAHGVAAASLYYVTDGHLWRFEQAPNAHPEMVLELPKGLADSDAMLIASSDGKRLVIGFPGVAIWFDTENKTSTLLPCRRSWVMSSVGRQVACTSYLGDVSVFDLEGTDTKRLLGEEPVTFATVQNRWVVWKESAYVLLPNTEGQSEITLWPKTGETSAILAAPNGTRIATTVKSDKAALPTLVALTVGDNSAPRILLKEAVPISFSGDSAWLFAQASDAACLVRASGGEYKCWDDYVGQAISHDGRFVLMYKKEEDKRNWFVASSLGVSSATPKSVGLKTTGPVVLAD